MEGEVPGSRSQRTQPHYVYVASGRFPSDRDLHNVSVQTGEEFSMEFLQDRGLLKGAQNRAGIDPGYAHRTGHNNSHPNFQPSNEDHTGITGIRRVDSDCSSEVSTVSQASFTRGHAVKNSGKEHVDTVRRIPSMNGIKSNESSAEEYSESCCQPRRYGSGSSDGSNPGKLKFICSSGGKILPRPSDGKLRYVGGEKRIISISTRLSWRELMQKTHSICSQPHTIKYQLPGEDLDALISVSSDEDLRNMIEEYYGLEKAIGSQRIRIFLVPLNETDSSSLDAGGLQSNLEYHYVVAVNNVADANLKNSLSVTSLPSQMGYQLDVPPSHHRDSSFQQADNMDRTAAQNHTRMTTHHLAPQLPFSSQFVVKPANLSPAFAAKTVEQIGSKTSQKQSFEDHGQSSDNYYAPDPRYFIPAAIHNAHPSKCHDVETPVTSGGLQFQNHQYMREMPPFAQNGRELGGNFYHEKPILQERGFHSELIQRQQEDSLSWVSGSNDSFHPLQGIPHSYSDSLLQEQVEREVSIGTSTSHLDFTTSSFPHDPGQSNLQEGTELSAQNRDFSDSSNLPYELQSANYKISQFSPEVSEFPHHPESCGESEFIYHLPHYYGKGHQHGHAINGTDSGSQDSHVQQVLVGDLLHWGDEKEDILPHDKKVYGNGVNVLPEITGSWLYANTEAVGAPPSSLTARNSCSDTSKYHSLGSQFDGSTPEICSEGRQSVSNQHSVTYRPTNDGSVQEEIDMMIFSVDIPRKKDSSETEPVITCGQSKVKDFYDVENSSGLINSSCSDPISYVPPGIMSQNLKNGKEHEIIRSVHSDTVGMSYDTGLTLNLHADNSSLGSLIPNPEKGGGLRRDVSLLDQDIFTYPNLGIRGFNHGNSVYTLKEENSESVGNEHGHIRIYTEVTIEEVTIEEVTVQEVTVEDVTDSVPSGIPVSPPIIPHVVDEPVEDGTGTTSSPKVTDADTNTPNSECEDGDEDESFTDAATAEVEAGIYGLQIIKNADLEELRELGSGTFGTVYYGKWRGTDVAIKRIKKSCFAGRSSEQERLIKDFWREAQILSKLHHPNVVAFYGVVPDGTGGTLATVTEFMVNGSLRHVLLRKDRTLDRRKRLIIAMDAAFGMEYLHSKNIVHFDLKCDNLLVNLRDSHRPICKVGDFGLSRIKRNTLVSGGVRGTLPWMAPELLNGSSNRVSEKVDVFSFGIAMWEILTGEEPYANMHCGAIIGGILNNTLRPAIPDRCDPAWRKLMEQCWAPDPSDRPSFTEITNRLRAISISLQPRGNTSR